MKYRTKSLLTVLVACLYFVFGAAYANDFADVIPHEKIVKQTDFVMPMRPDGLKVTIQDYLNADHQVASNFVVPIQPANLVTIQDLRNANHQIQSQKDWNNAMVNEWLYLTTG